MVVVRVRMYCMTPPSSHEIEIPAESRAIKRVYQQSGLTVADLAAATDLSVGTIHVALSGIRYRGSEARLAVPSDRTLVRLASALGLTPEFLRHFDRDRAADLLAEAGEPSTRPAFPAEQDAQVAVAARSVLTRQILSVFSTEELRAELERRDQSEQEAERRENDRELWDTLRTEQMPL